MKRSGKPAGEDFADNRVPGKGQKKVRNSLTNVTELDNQGALIRTPRDRVGGPSGRRGDAGDAGHRQAVPTPSDGPHTRPAGRLSGSVAQHFAMAHA